MLAAGRISLSFPHTAGRENGKNEGCSATTGWHRPSGCRTLRHAHVGLRRVAYHPASLRQAQRQPAPERMRGLVALATAMRSRCTPTSRPWALSVGRYASQTSSAMSRERVQRLRAAAGRVEDAGRYTGTAAGKGMAGSAVSSSAGCCSARPLPLPGSWLPSLARTVLPTSVAGRLTSAARGRHAWTGADRRARRR